ncbi:MAG: HEAT repeat domain-containing protein [Phycisphaerales bacterium]|nr:HEAT repeat domain-containing protein [Phycisphaerales bacterium]
MADNNINANNTAGAIKALSEMIKSDDPETQRAGKRQLWQMVRHTGRPGNVEQQQAMVDALLGLLGPDESVAVKREAVWAVSELGDDTCIEPVAALLADQELREDACRVLERLPGQKSLDTLQAALLSVPEEFKLSVAQALRARGVTVEGLPCRKLEPSRATQVKPVNRA